MTQRVNFDRFKRFKPGTRVHLLPPHVWAGEHGEVMYMDTTTFGMRPKVKLDSGLEVFVVDPETARILR